MAKLKHKLPAARRSFVDQSSRMRIHVARDAQATLLKFGSVEVIVAPPSAGARLVNVRAGQSALRRAAAGIAQPGVNISQRQGVPQFRADPEDPGRLIRRTDGVEERGVFVDGVFRVQG